MILSTIGLVVTKNINQIKEKIMATRSVIAKLDNSEKGAKAIYCHSDGYLDYVGKILDEHYQNESKVDELLAHGDLSSLDKNIGEKLDFNDYKLFYEKEQCRFYHRDRGEKLNIETLTSEEDILDYASSCCAEYIYMFAYGSWYVYKDNVKQFVELEEVLYENA